MDGLRPHSVQNSGQMGGPSGRRVYTGYHAATGGSGGPPVGHEGGPEAVDDGADEDPPPDIGTDPEELQDSFRLGRDPSKPRKDLL